MEAVKGQDQRILVNNWLFEFRRWLANVWFSFAHYHYFVVIGFTIGFVIDIYFSKRFVKQSFFFFNGTI